MVGLTHEAIIIAACMQSENFWNYAREKSDRFIEDNHQGTGFEFFFSASEISHGENDSAYFLPSDRSMLALVLI